ncbi:MAG: hypothetical protein S4CHLAM102_04800 [Chlamydiia bacterium]|nr:hypothetical protein [Chlamydiia bacterium]
MLAFLVGEDGPFAGAIFPVGEELTSVIGRDPDSSNVLLEDPMVSRKHASIEQADGQFFIENQSSVNPVTINSNPVVEKTLLSEGDVLQVGSTLFRFTLEDPRQEVVEEVEEAIDEGLTLSENDPFSLMDEESARWMLKVISGPNSGAEFGINPGQTLVIGKDPAECDVIFQDLSVSRRHAKVVVDEEGQAFVEDLKSRNGTLLGGIVIKEKAALTSQDLISMGTTSFLMIDREQSRETLFSPSPSLDTRLEMPGPAEKEIAEVEEAATPKTWRDIFVPTRHIVLTCLFLFVCAIGAVGLISLFGDQSIAMSEEDDSSEIKAVVRHFPAVEFSYNHATEKVFLLGNVLTESQHSELLYMIQSLPAIRSTEDNVVVDELVWENMNALIAKNPAWRGVNFSSTRPGEFVMRGYVESAEEKAELEDWVNQNFPYLDKLGDEVVIEQNLQTQVQNLLIENGFGTVSLQANNGELVFSGRVTEEDEKSFDHLLIQINKLHGVRSVKNYVIYTTHHTAFIDLSSKYQVLGTSKVDNTSEYVLIDGKILSKGDTLDGMEIYTIENNAVLLEKDGVKYKIDYNLQ